MLVWWNWPGLAPAILIPLMLRVALPEFESVIACAALVAPGWTLPKLRLPGLRTACGAAAAAPIRIRRFCDGAGASEPP